MSDIKSMSFNLFSKIFQNIKKLLTYHVQIKSKLFLKKTQNIAFVILHLCLKFELDQISLAKQALPLKRICFLQLS